MFTPIPGPATDTLGPTATLFHFRLGAIQEKRNLLTVALSATIIAGLVYSGPCWSPLVPSSVFPLPHTRYFPSFPIHSS